MAFLLGGLKNLLASRAEVLGALGRGLGDAPGADDAVRPDDVPSVATRGAGDRVLAEIDHDGFAFAACAEDAPFFEGRATRLRRQGNLVDVVLDGGRVRLRKRFRAPSLSAVLPGQLRITPREWALRNVWRLGAAHFYGEVAALLRLRDLPFVPQLRQVDVRARTLWTDYLAAGSLRHEAARAGEPVHDADLPPGVAGSGDELDRREGRLLDAVAGTGWRGEVAAMAREINRRGVVPLDIKLGNFLRGRRSGRLYWIDFERSRLDSQPGFADALSTQHDLLRDLFGIVASEEPAGASRARASTRARAS